MTRLAIAFLGALALAGCASADRAPAEEPAKPRAKRSEEVSKHPEWPEDVKAAILEGRVTIGMTASHVVACWGRSLSGSTTDETAGGRRMTMNFRRLPHVDGIADFDDQCPPGLWTVGFEEKKAEDGKSRYFVTSVSSR